MLVEYPRHRSKRSSRTKQQLPPNTPPCSVASYAHPQAAPLVFTLSDVVRRMGGECTTTSTPITSTSTSSTTKPHPITLLPPELVSLIFTFCLPADQYITPSSHSAPLLLTHISHTFRSIAHSTPDLWSSLHLSYKDPLLDVELSREWLARSGERDLKLSLAVDFWNEEKQALLDVFCEKSVKARWKEVKFELRHAMCAGLYHLDGSSPRVPRAMIPVDDTALPWSSTTPNLTSFELHASDLSTPNLMPVLRLLSNAPKLEEVLWVDDFPEMDMGVLMQLPLGRIRRLGVIGGGQAGEGTPELNGGGMLGLLERCENLESVKITRPSNLAGAPEPDPASTATNTNVTPKPTIYLPKLRTLNISYDLTGLLDHLVLPSLSSVRIYSDSGEEGRCGRLPLLERSLSYPHLPYPPSNSHSTQWSPMPLLSLLHRSGCSLSSLTLCAPMSEDALMQCIQDENVSPDLKKLVVRGSGTQASCPVTGPTVVVGDSVVEALTLGIDPPAAKARACGGYCPHLEEIELLDMRVGCAQGALVRMVESRLGLYASGLGEVDGIRDPSISQPTYLTDPHSTRPHAHLRRLRMLDGHKDVDVIRSLHPEEGESQRGCVGGPTFVYEVVPLPAPKPPRNANRRYGRERDWDRVMFRRKVCASR